MLERNLPKLARIIIDVVGEEMAITVFLTFGGSFVYLSEAPEESEWAKLIGVDHAREIARRFDVGSCRIPLCNAWLITVLHRRGFNINHIARRLRTTDTSVRYALNKKPSDISRFTWGGQAAQTKPVKKVASR